MSFKDYLNEATKPKKSNCCDAPIEGQEDEGYGRCSDCGEMASVGNVEVEESAETSSSGFKKTLQKNLDKDIAFGERHKKSDRKYWEGALDVLYDYKKIVDGL
tara:strand:- start:670 stop:978 length:309 start_codon:yes stop_codon:yes gene_type:complete